MWGGYPPNPPLFFFFFLVLGVLEDIGGPFVYCGLVWIIVVFWLGHGFIPILGNLGVSLGGGKVVGGSKNFLFPIGRKIGGEVGEYANS